VAHVLWGGLLMGTAIVLVEILPGTQVRVRSAFIGGIGFGLFIDEVGKFLTKDVNYFFRPAVAIMYAVFVGAYLGVRWTLQRRKLNDRRRLALAAIALSDLALGQLDARTRDYAVRLLEGVDETSALAQTAAAVHQALLYEQPRHHGFELRLTRTRDWLEDVGKAIVQRAGRPLLLVLFLLALADLVFSLVTSFVHPGRASRTHTLLDVGLPSLISFGVLVAGLVTLRRWQDRRQALRLLQWSVLVEMLFTQVVVFNRLQFAGLIGFAVDVLVLNAVRGALAVEDDEIEGPVTAARPAAVGAHAGRSAVPAG
jgi:hypothetical protein